MKSGTDSAQPQGDGRLAQQAIRGVRLSPQQRRLWSLQQENPAYCAQLAISLQGDLRKERLKQALQSLVERHQVLRTTFRSGSPATLPIQVVESGEPFDWKEADLSSGDPAGQKSSLGQFLLQERRRPFDLERGPVLQAALLKCSSREHVLMLRLPSLCADSWTLKNLAREISLCYDASGQAGSEVMQYAQFSEWQNELREGESAREGEEYWNQWEATSPQQVKLHFGREPSNGAGFEPRRLAVSIEPRSQARLEALAEGCSATPGALLLVCWQTLLWRLSGLAEIVVGSAVDGREYDILHSALGLFAKWLPVRSRFEADFRYSELAGDVVRYLRDSYEWQAFFSPIEQGSTGSGKPSGFNFGFEFEERAEPIVAAGVTFSVCHQYSCIEPFDLKLTCVRSNGALQAEYHYNPGRFGAPEVGSLADQFATLLENVLENPQQAVGRLRLISQAGLHRQLIEFNQSLQPYPRDRSICSLFEEWAGRSPQRVAAGFGGHLLSYGELNARADQLAGHLTEWTVGPEALIGLCVRRSASMVVGMLGILKAGCAYLPLDVKNPKDRLAFMLSDGQVPVLLTQQDLLASLPKHKAQVICLDSGWPSLAQPPCVARPRRGDSSNLAYVIYTSGSTGMPKGVAVPHFAVVRLVINTDYAALRPGDRVAQAANISFDAATFEVWGPLLQGGCLMGVDQETLLAPGNMRSWLRRNGITTLFLTTALFNQIAQQAPDAFATLDHLLFGGEAVDPKWVRRTLKSGAPRRLLHVYGPTESTTFSSWQLVTEVAEQASTVSIGGPIANTTLYLLDSRLQAVPWGVPGELFIGGDGLARGYWRRPALTAGHFVSHPFARGERLYRTGDRVRLGLEGGIEFLGRIDDQLKIRGFRIEPGEIEATLSRHPGVQKALVLARDQGPGKKQLAAFVQSKWDPAPRPAELRGFLSEQLPAYMMPKAFTVLDEFPMTPSGKIDRKALPEGLTEEQEQVYRPPATPVEELLAVIWADILELDPPGRDDNFFDLGGHSLLATQVVSRARRTFEVEFPLRALFEAPRLSDFARLIEEARRCGEYEAPPPLEPVSRDQDLPLSFAQLRLWFLDQLIPGDSLYNIPTALRMTGRLEIPVMRASVEEVLRRHEALRSYFVTRDGQPFQKIRAPEPFLMPLVDLEACPPEIREAELAGLVHKEAMRSFDLESGPLLRIQIVRLGSQEYTLLATMHHIVSDGWSMGVLVRELTEIYQAFSSGRPSPLDELPIQYADFAWWQQEWLSGEVLERQMAYWKETLQGGAVLELQTDHPRPEMPTHRGTTTSFHLPVELSNSVKKLSRQRDATLYMVLLAAFKVLQFRYSGQTDISVGTPIANRNRTEIENLIGFFVNTLVFRSDLSGRPGFAEVLSRVREQAIDAYTYQDLPFEKIVEALQPERTLSRTPLFQVMFVLQNAPRETLRIPQMSLVAVSQETKVSPFDMTMVIQESGEYLIGTVEYSVELFDASTIERMHRHFRILLEEMVSDLERPVADLPMLAAFERQQVLVEWNADHSEPTGEQTIQQLFEAQSERRPEALAVESEGLGLTYGELNRRSNQLARHLSSLGAGPDLRVGIFVRRSLRMMEGLLGILKAGAAYLPLDPDLPNERLAFMLQDSRALLIVTDRSMPDSLSGLQTSRVYLDAEWAEIAGRPVDNPAPRALARHAAYVIYTSGSTGRPKGVIITHHSLVHFGKAAIQAYRFYDTDRILQFAPLSFDIAVEEIFPALACGASLVLRNDEMIASSADFLKHCRRMNLTVLDLPTAYWHQLSADLAPEALQVPSSLRLVIIGGEKAQPERLQAWRRLVGGYPLLINGYGPTESTVAVSLYQSRGAAAEQRLAIIGRPMCSARIYLGDPAIHAVPPGVEGEILIGGSGLARGYHNSPAQTAQRFVPDPFGNQPGRRLYRSGDSAFQMPDGQLAFLGRIDNQVKIRGFRVEPGEIEAALSEHPAIDRCAVLSRGSTPGLQKLVAYACTQWEPFPSAAELRGFLSESLPNYMVPQAFVLLKELPITPSGKVDRMALPKGLGADQGPTFVPARTTTEELVAGIWVDILKQDRIGADSNFFESGGHSLLATQVVSRIRQTFGFDLPLRTLFEVPTVAQLASKIEEVILTDHESQIPPISLASRKETLPLSFAQQRLWFLDQLIPNSPLYNIPIALRLRGAMDEAALQESFRQIVRRHEVLRTSFPSIDGKPHQLIGSNANLPMPRIDLADLPDWCRESELERLVLDEAERPFQLGIGPLLRVHLVRLQEEESAALITMHHIVSDGWSLGILMREISVLYLAYSRRRPSPLEDLPIQYADFADWQRTWLDGAVHEGQLRYWKDNLHGAPPLQLPSDRPRSANPTHRGARHAFQLSAALSSALKSCSHKHSVTLYMTLLAAFQSLLSRYSGQTDICIGSPIANRNQAMTERLIGFFVNTLVLRTDLSGGPSFDELLKRVRETALGAYAHQDVPFEQVVEALQPERSLNRTPLFQVMLIFQNTPPYVEGLSGLEEIQVAPLAVDTVSSSRFDLSLSIEEVGDRLSGLAVYNVGLYDSPTVIRMIDHFVRLLEALASDPSRRLSTVPFVGDAESHQLLHEWASCLSRYPRGESVHALFEAQQRARPDAVAVVFGQQALSYSGLNRTANQLAHYMRRQGATCEAVAGILAERSLELVPAILATLKAGAAYLPLDPSYPSRRLSLMLEDAGCTFLVSQERLLDRVPCASARTICLDSAWQQISQCSPTGLDVPFHPLQMAYVIYTSGSTGTPRGVAVPHRGVVRLVQQVNYADLNSDEVFLLVAPISFDASTFEIWAGLLNGARLVVFPARQPDAEGIAHELLRHGVTTLHLSAVLFHWMARERPEALARLHQLFAGGDVLSPTHARQALQAGVGRLINSYGPSENTTYSSCHVAEPPGAVPDPVPIGRPVSNSSVYVLDDELAPLPVGVPGELYCGGDGLGRGYWNQPAETARCFAANPFQYGRRLFRSGDRARWRADGQLEFLGRLDNQVKIRGFRIELGEVEAALRGHPSVLDCAVASRQESGGEKRLVAYLVCKEETAGSSELRSFLQERLPGFMVPSAFVRLDKLQLTGSGKIDRKALPDPGGDRMDSPGILVPPRDSLELRLARVWEEVLQVWPVGVRDDFFGLGGHSLLAVHLLARIERAVGRKPPLGALFQEATVEHLAKTLRRQVAAPRTSMVEIQPRGNRPPFFCVHPAGGGVFGYMELARRMGTDQPFYGLQASDQDAEEWRELRVEEMASRYLREVQSLDPEGPYLLGGHSFGGLVAFEMACQIRKQGREVALLALLDSQPPVFGAPRAEAPAAPLAVFAASLGLSSKDLPWEEMEHQAQLHLSPILDLAKQKRRVPPDLEPGRFRLLFEMLQAHIRAGRKYRPRPCWLPSALLLPLSEWEGKPGAVESHHPQKRTGALWRELTGPSLEVHGVPGDHFSMLQAPMVEKLAERLTLCLSEAAESCKGGKGSRLE